MKIPDDCDVAERFDDWVASKGLEREHAIVAALELFLAAPEGIRCNALAGETDRALELMSIVLD